jgi:membrane-associated phospholipid phosphatase
LSFRGAIVVALLVFGVLAWQVLVAGPVTVFDQQVTLWLASHRRPWLTETMLLVSELHETTKVLVATMVLAAVMAWRRAWTWIAALAVVPTGMVLNVGLKQLFVRARPVLDEPLVQLSTFSFPSGHGVASTVFYGAIGALVLAQHRGRIGRRVAIAACMAMVAVVCFSRVYLGAHYLSDVLAAVAVGLTWLTIWVGATRRVFGGSSDER